MCVCVCLYRPMHACVYPCAHACGRGVIQNRVRRRVTRRETLQGKGWGWIGRGLFDKQTCYPIRRWKRVWEEEPEWHCYPVAMRQMRLIDMSGGGTYAWGPVWIL